MSKVNDGGWAFPWPEPTGTEVRQFPGMTLRDWFAGQALVGLVISDPSGMKGDEKLAQWAFMLADALIAEREKGK